jgi:heptosyltransferase-2
MIRYHKSKIYCEVFKLAGYQINGSTIYLNDNRYLKNQGRILLPSSMINKKLLFIAPGSGKLEAHKRWPAKFFGQLAELAIINNLFDGVVVIGEEKEKELLDEVIENISQKSSCISFPSTSITKTLSLFFHASCLVTNCNGLSHIASLVNIPIIGIYGPTNPLFTGPQSDRFYFIRQRLQCSPCYRNNFKQGCKYPICMTNIMPEYVFSSLKMLLSGGKNKYNVWDNNSFSKKPINIIRQ